MDSIGLGQWVRENQPEEKMIWKSAFHDQMNFLLNVLPEAIASSLQEKEAIEMSMHVISTHMSKSIILPVVQINLRDGTIILLRNNFQDWKVSINSPKDLYFNPMDTFDPEKKVDSVYCEGFPWEMVFESYSQDKRRFTFEISDNYALFTCFWIISYNKWKDGKP